MIQKRKKIYSETILNGKSRLRPQRELQVEKEMNKHMQSYK